MTLKVHFRLFSSRAKPGNGKSRPMFVLDTSSSEKNKVEEKKMRLRHQGIGFSPKLLCVSLSALAFIFKMAVCAV